MTHKNVGLRRIRDMVADVVLYVMMIGVLWLIFDVIDQSTKY